jgi:hypothetical protein
MHKYGSLININLLINYMKTISGYSYLRVAVIQIDIHPVGETWSTHHMHSMLDPRMALDHTYLTWSTYSNLLWSCQQRWTDALLSRKSAPNSTSQFDWVAHRTHLSFSPNIVIEAVRLSQASIDDRLLGLLGTYHQYTISTFNTCLRGSTHRSLTDTCGGYNIRCASCHITLPDLNRWSSAFHLRAPPGLRLLIQQFPIQLGMKQTLNLTSENIHSTSTISYHLSISCANNKHQVERDIKDKPEGQS